MGYRSLFKVIYTGYKTNNITIVLLLLTSSHITERATLPGLPAGTNCTYLTIEEILHLIKTGS